jgi:hypothetical protein
MQVSRCAPPGQLSPSIAVILQKRSNGEKPIIFYTVWCICVGLDNVEVAVILI